MFQTEQQQGHLWKNNCLITTAREAAAGDCSETLQQKNAANASRFCTLAFCVYPSDYFAHTKKKKLCEFLAESCEREFNRKPNQGHLVVITFAKKMCD